MKTPVNFELGKLLTEKGFDEISKHFYVKPRCKVFGVDEQGRVYPVKNIPKKLYTIDDYAVSKSENVYVAPSIAEVVCWIYSKYDIWIEVRSPDYSGEYWSFEIHKPYMYGNYGDGSDYNSPTEGYIGAITYTLNNLI